MDDFFFWLEREPIYVPNRLRCAKLILMVARYSDIYVYQWLMAVLPVYVSRVYTPRAMAGRSCWPAVDHRLFLLHRIYLKYLQVQPFPNSRAAVLRDSIRRVLVDGAVPLSTPEKITGKCMSIKVTIRPASLWTHYVFEANRNAQCPHHRFWQHRVRVPQRSSLHEELDVWYGLTENSQKGPWYLTKHFAVELMPATSGAFAIPWGRVIVAVAFFTLTDRASTIPSNIRGCQSGTWSAGQEKYQRNKTKQNKTKQKHGKKKGTITQST